MDCTCDTNNGFPCATCLSNELKELRSSIAFVTKERDTLRHRVAELDVEVAALRQLCEERDKP